MKSACINPNSTLPISPKKLFRWNILVLYLILLLYWEIAGRILAAFPHLSVQDIPWAQFLRESIVRFRYSSDTWFTRVENRGWNNIHRFSFSSHYTRQTQWRVLVHCARVQLGINAEWSRFVRVRPRIPNDIICFGIVLSMLFLKFIFMWTSSKPEKWSVVKRRNLLNQEMLIPRIEC